MDWLKSIVLVIFITMVTTIQTIKEMFPLDSGLNLTHSDSESTIHRDMNLTRNQKEIFSRRTVRQAATDYTQMWPREHGIPVVPYKISTNESGRPIEKVVKWVIKVLEQRSCLKFHPKNDDDEYYLYFQTDKDEKCDAHLGFEKKAQIINLPSFCRNEYRTLHYVSMALGLVPLTKRRDRDDYIDVLMENIMPNRTEEFKMVEEAEYTDYGIPFDFSSIMNLRFQLYTANGKPTTLAKDPKYTLLMGEIKMISHRDKLLLNTMYGCLDGFKKKCEVKEDTCVNEGYLGPRCKCVCPNGAKGDKCQEKVGDYYDTYLNKSSCDQEVTEDGTTILSPNKWINETYIEGDTRCTYLIKAPINQTIEVIFSSFNIEECDNQYTNNTPRCCSSSLHFAEMKKETDMVKTVCGKEMDGKTYTSETNELAILLNNWMRRNGSEGFEANIRFINSASTKTMYPGVLFSLISLVVRRIM